ncbi:MAG: DUF4838 domain-containing protein [Oscillospiraceae bacterium]|jgi:hypothetical protein|nr:DUF4838 domain-containing protein [Oscillospiraceae bacterium]
MQIKAWFLAVFAVLQNFFIMVGVLPMGTPHVEYGGTPYEAQVIAEPMAIVENGGSDYKIVVSESASASEVTAANELQTYIAQISGCTLPIVPDTAPVTEHEICVGLTSREGEYYTLDRGGLGDEGFVLKVFDERLVIAGGALRGTLYGVYTFLEERLGCRWFTPELSVIPENSDIIIDKQLDDKQVPIFEYRDDFWTAVQDAPFKAKQKLNSSAMNIAPLGEEYGGGVSYADFAHSMERLVPDSLFDTHPEYFSYRESEGKRTTRQRCLTNPDVLALTIETARNTLNANPSAKIMSITQNDNQDYCQCENCKAMDEQYGGPSGTNIWFVNAVAEALEEEFPNVQFDTFAYQYTRSAPTGIAPRDNVIVRLCSIECCFAHPLSECGHERHEDLLETVADKPSTFAADIEGWSAISNTLYVWDYTTNFREYMLPFPNLHVLSANMQYFAENNVKGVFEQGNHTGGKSGEFGELRAYIIAKLLWDPYADVEYHMTDFMKAYYGEEAAGYIKDYIDLITYKVKELSHLFIFNRSNEVFTLSRKEAQKADALWKAALESSDITEQQRLNIERSELSYRYFKGCVFLSEFSLLNPNRVKENEKLYNDIKDHGIARLTEWTDLSGSPSFLLRPSDWS